MKVPPIQELSCLLKTKNVTLEISLSKLAMPITSIPMKAKLNRLVPLESFPQILF
jgi:hypothetical protein